ncbi:hypothetical protein B484DRAFT_450245 [Ochromonadaceae sp. CCMP2298]|nr:hypothetical protein B484DRAFT_450245 [Ochromonadaceae sp. CCMP2298]
MNVNDILEESPNGYDITRSEPIVVDEAIRYYLGMLEQYSAEDFPVEFGMVHYAMGKVLFGDQSKPKVSEERAKRIENALYHLNQSMHVFDSKDYPTMFAVISTMMARLFRERATLISNRSFLADRSSPEDSVQYGVDQVLEAFPVYFHSKSHDVEHSICALEAGWLHVMQTEFLDNFRDDSIREQAATYLERAVFLSQDALQGGQQKFTVPGEKGKEWHPAKSQPEDFPQHIRLLLEGHRFSFIEGSALYLLGRLYQGWTVDESAEGEDPEFELANQEKAFSYFSKCVRPKYLPEDCFLWADAHHRAAITLIKYPRVVNPDHRPEDLDASDIHMEVALTHLGLALRCKALKPPEAMDLHFHLAQTAISRLQLIIDRVPLHASVTKALAANSEGLDLIQLVELHLDEARKRVTAASMQSTQDGYLYFFASLKVSEFRMLEAACKPHLQPVEREQHLCDAVEHLVEVLQARTLTDNMDLHYVASAQLSQLLLAVKRSFAATKSYAKCLFTLSALINRSLFNPEDVQAKLSEEILRQVGQALTAGARDVPWVKLHFGPVSLNERVTAGYASWSFEETKSTKPRMHASSSLLNLEDASKYRDKKGGLDPLVTAPFQASPPRGVPPLNLPLMNQKRVHVSGEDMDMPHMPDSSPMALGASKKKPPAGAIPLFAMGHNPEYDVKYDAAGDSDYYLGPYGRRMRRRIPPSKDMFDIDKHNLSTFGSRNGKANFLLPGHMRSKAHPIPVKVKPVEEEDEEEEEEEEGEEEEEEEDDEDAEERSLAPSIDDAKEGDDDDEAASKAPSKDPSIVNRSRSKTIKPPPPSHAPPTHAPGASVASTSTYNIHTVLPLAKQQSVLQWFFSKSKRKEKAPKPVKPKRRGFFGALFRRAEAVEQLFETAGMWCSSQCFYTFMVLSRQSRMQLVLRCSKLHALDGERANYSLYQMPPQYLNTYYSMKKLLSKDCAALVVPPTSLKELSQRHFLELQELFKSQVKVCRKLDDMEHLLYNKISKLDYFLPLIMSAPVFTRDLGELDKSLLDSEALLQNLSNENAMQSMALPQKGGKNDHKGSVGGSVGKASFAYDSVSSAAGSSYGGVTTVPEALTQKQQEEEEVAVGKMSLSLSQSLDGANYLRNGQQGSREMLEKYLAQDECMLIWHMPVMPSQKMQVVLAWRDNSESLHEKYSSTSSGFSAYHSHAEPEADKKTAKKKKKKGSKGKGDKEEDEEHGKGIIFELAQSDLDTSHMYAYLQGYLDALHSRSAPMQATMSTDALRALSCALSLTEFLHMIPPHVKSLVICCPPAMRIIPWHLLLIEQPDEKTTEEAGSLGSLSPMSASRVPAKPIEVHLLEKFCVRLGPTLALFELNATGGRLLRHSAGLHRLCAVDGEAIDAADRSAGVRGTDLEVACVSNTWSLDPGDSHVLANDSAVPKAVQTGLFGDGNDDDYRGFKQEIYIKRREKKDHMKAKGRGDDHFVSAVEKQIGKKRGGKEDAGGGEVVAVADEESVHSEEEEVSSSSSEESDEGRGGARGQNKKKKKKLTFKDTDRKALTMCRVLHISAYKVSFLPQGGAPSEAVGNADERFLASVELPQFDKLHHFRDPRAQRRMQKRNRDERLEDARNTLSSLDVVQQVYVQNCALCLLSRFGLTDDLLKIKGRSKSGAEICDTNCEFIESLHLAGAKTVLSPIWGGEWRGLGTLANLVFIIRFYSILPAHSKERLSVVVTVRIVQLWLRDATADAIIAFVHKAPIPAPARKLIIDEMESYVSASLTAAQQKLKQAQMERQDKASKAAAPSNFISPEKRDPNAGAGVADGGVEGEAGPSLLNRIGGDQKFFNHFVYWGSFAVSGTGGNVHHPLLTENEEEGFEEGHIGWDDKELNNMAFEANMLRLEGKTRDAKELEALIRKMKVDRFKSRVNKARATGARAGRGLMDTLDFLDKTLLDQDSDEISVSDDSEEERRRRKLKKENRARESDSDEYDSDVGAEGKGPMSPLPREGSPTGAAVTPSAKPPGPKFEPKALDLGSMKAKDIGFDKWRSKVGTMTMDIRQPVLQARTPRTPKKDNSDFANNKRVQDAVKKEEGGEDYEEKMERVFQKKERQKARKLAAAAGKGDGSDSSPDEDDDDDDEGDVDAKVRKIAKRKQLERADEESESEYEGSDEEEEEEEEDEEDGLYKKTKKLRRRKDRLRQGKGKQKRKPTRFQLAMREVRGGVRSYSSVVKQIAEAPQKGLSYKKKVKRKETLAPGEDDEGGGCTIA